VTDTNPYFHHIRQAVSDAHQIRLNEEQQRDAVARAQAEQHAADAERRFEQTIAAIPKCISCHFADGRTYGRIMRLRFDESSQDPRLQGGYWDAYKPNPNLLLDAGMKVYRYCHDHKLKPYLVRDYDFDVHCFFLYIGINCCDHLD